MKFKSLPAVLLASLLTTSATSAMARPMITDLSSRSIKINAKFSGKEIFLYGARVEAGNIVVVIRGPEDDYIVRKKEKIGGIWVNTDSVEFKNVPQFYRIASSTPLDRLGAEKLIDKLGIGFDTVHFDGKPSASSVDINEFENALKNRMKADQAFDFDVVNLPFLEGTLFRVNIKFPAKISDGMYTAEVYSFNDGQLSGMQSIPIEAKKTGIEAFIFDSAHERPALYGLACILLAIAGGVIAGRFFKKF